MKGKNAQGIAVLVFGLLLLAGGILVLVFVPTWGNWLAQYPGQLAKMPLPPEAAPIVKGLGGALGPLLQQIGGCYIRAAGYFVGSLMTIIAIGITFVGSTLLRKGQI